MKKKSLYKFLLHTANSIVQRVSNQELFSERRILLLEKSGPYIPKLPVNFIELPTAMQLYFREAIEFPTVYLHQLRRMAISWHMVVFHRLRIFLPALAHPREEGHYNNAYLFQELLGKRVRPPREARPLALVHNQWTGSNYYHWLVDSLPRLLLLQDKYADCRLLMPSPVAAFVRESAALMGFADLLPLEAGYTLVNADLLIPDHVAAPGYQHPELLRQVREQLIAKMYPDGHLPVPHRRIYASRRLQRVRRLLNEHAVEEMLKQYGYEFVEFENLSFTEQIKLMAETTQFISIHGAGLTNMLFLPQGAQVGELLNKDKLIQKKNKDFENLIYFRMAAALQHSYYCLPCAGVGDDMLTNEAHLQVDVAAFERLLRLINS